MDFLQHLPQDLVLNHILGRLDFTSRVRIRAVCRAWRDLSPPPLPDMPWLWLTNFSRSLFPTFSMLNLSSSTTHRPCRCPASALKASGSRGQYLTLEMMMKMETTMEKQRQLRPCYTMYNPFTGDTFQLPCTFRDKHGQRHPMKPWDSTQLSSNPPNSCVVAAWDSYPGLLYFCRPGDQDWVEGPDPPTIFLWDMIFYKGQLYCIEDEEIVTYVHIIQHVHNSEAPLRHVVIDFKDVLCDVDGRDWNQREFYPVE